MEVGTKEFKAVIQKEIEKISNQISELDEIAREKKGNNGTFESELKEIEKLSGEKKDLEGTLRVIKEYEEYGFEILIKRKEEETDS